MNWKKDIEKLEWKFNILFFVYVFGYMKLLDLSMIEIVVIYWVYVERVIVRVKKNENFRLKSRF